MRHLRSLQIAIALLLTNTLSAPSAMAQSEAPFVGVLEWEFSSRALSLIQPWLAPTPPAGPECAPFLEPKSAEISRLTLHSEHVLSSLLTGLFTDLGPENLSRAPADLKVLPISLSDAFSEKPGEFFQCLSTLSQRGLQVLSVSIGIPDTSEAAQANQAITALFAEFAQTHPALQLVIAAGNHGRPLEEFNGAPQSLCRQRLPNVFCVSKFSAWIQQPGKPPRQATGSETDPYELQGNYFESGETIATFGASTSDTAPKFARVLFQALNAHMTPPLRPAYATVGKARKPLLAF